MFGEDLKVRESASPLSQVRAGLPPFLVLFAGREVPGLAQQADEFATSLRKAGNRVELKGIDRASHTTILFGLDRPGNPVGRLLLDFVQQVATVQRDTPPPPTSSRGAGGPPALDSEQAGRLHHGAKTNQEQAGRLHHGAGSPPPPPGPSTSATPAPT